MITDLPIGMIVRREDGKEKHILFDQKQKRIKKELIRFAGPKKMKFKKVGMIYRKFKVSEEVPSNG